MCDKTRIASIKHQNYKQLFEVLAMMSLVNKDIIVPLIS